jgi:hypothetical protein
MLTGGFYAVYLIWFATHFHGESYPNSEKYIIEFSVDETIDKIKEYKVEHPLYRQYEINIVDKIPYEFGYFTEIKYDGNANVTTKDRTSNASWYDFSFYIKQSRSTVGCCINLRQHPAEIQL